MRNQNKSWWSDGCLTWHNDDGSCVGGDVVDCPFGRAHPGTSDTSCRLGNWDEEGRIWDMAGYAMDAIDVISLVNPVSAAGKFAVKYAVKEYLKKRAKDGIAKEVAQKEADNLARQLAKEMDDAVQAGKNCANSFTGNTVVVMGDGSRKPISEIMLDDVVLAKNPTNGLEQAQPVTALIRNGGAHEMVRLGFGGDTFVDATLEHPFWSVDAQQYVDAGDLKVGERVLAGSGARVKVESSWRYTENLIAYNLQVDQLHTYQVSDLSLLVHNKCENPLTTKQQNDLASYLGYAKMNERTRNEMPIFKKDNKYISFDRDGHNGGVWKMADSVEELNSKQTRLGTYNYDLTVQIGG
ncbi:MAG: toxin C-terminal domain-containing protein [Mycobacteriaceae bacterium]